MSVLDLAYERIEKKLEELEATDDYFRGLRVGLIDALELIDILDMELDGRLPAGDDVREHLNLPPKPEPDWLDAPVVLATCGCRGMELWQPNNEKDGTWECAHCGLELHWSELRDVTPLYRKEEEGEWVSL